MSDFDKSDWDKTVVPESSGLGIRSTINRTLNSHEDTLHSEAMKLFESMNVMEEIIEALNLGKTSVSIGFPKGLESAAHVIGNYRWVDVAKKLVELIQAEGVHAKYTRKRNLGGCCDTPAKYKGSPTCSSCYEVFTLHSRFSLHTLELEELK